MITIIDYGSGNIRAIGNIYDTLKIDYKIAKSPEEVIGAEKIFLPGVGAFDATISMLDKTGFREVLDSEVMQNKVPIIGICVGMQILAESSEEGKLPGLGYIKGKVKKMDASLLNQKPRLPHLGWNSIEIVRQNVLLQNIDSELGFYFLHSYYFECENQEDILTTTTYGKSFASAINHDNVYGIQFHPEKSHHNGINLLHNFATL
ncbi:imidazole glycerol phosphate synthase subunit HisH [Flavobacterium sp. RSP15]|uniref:imidazole glycerol phosphate synthase subunit HisH n=1 Tax=Flavobacterium sp. RSP15 TaxID=2497485 RepID=UPI000F848CE2|nr:imidazole glycerol phosphate synthase subunit HisH [Flavobacterium sp. RSP15]RTY86013.1 imidazole glycerol phosphate synthase subunit HisH [Flavobacterium sp. RSP15]